MGQPLKAAPAQPFDAIIFLPADAGSDGAEAIRFAGLSLLQRQIRLMKVAGATRVHVAAEMCRGNWPAGAERVLLARGDLLLDRRLIEAVLGQPEDGLLVGSDGEPAAMVTSRRRAETMAAGRADARALSELLGDAAGAGRIAPPDVSAYSIRARRDIPVRVLPVADRGEARTAEKLLLADAQAGILDWPARFLHAPVENALVRLLWRTPVTPNQVSIVTFLLGLGAGAGFALGAFWVGLSLALLVGLLDGVDGKLARTRLQFSRLGELEHLGDKIVEYGSYFGLAVALAPQFGVLPMFACAFAASAGMAGDVAITAAGLEMLGRSLDDAGPFERRWRLFAGRRNTHMWLLVPFGLFGAWAAGLVVIALSAQVTMLVKAWRLYVRARERADQRGRS